MSKLQRNVTGLGVAAVLLVVFVVCVSPHHAKSPASSEAVVPLPTAQAPASAAPGKINAWQAAVLGVVEGLTEYLPVSSTGHMILTSQWLGLTPSEGGGQKIAKNPAVDSFEVVIQLGAILAVVGLYRRRVSQMCTGLGSGASALMSKRTLDALSAEHRSGLHLAGLLLVAFLPAAIIGKLFHERIEEHLFAVKPVVYALAVGGLLMIVVEYFFWHRRREGDRRVTQVDQVQYWQALVIGCAQVLAMWPGTSRSMMTIIAALVVGLDMVAAAEFSFLLALPTLGAATLYSGYKHWGPLMDSAGVSGLLIGLVVSGIVAAIAVKGLVKWLTRHGLMPFGVYRILLAGALFYFLTRG